MSDSMWRVLDGNGNEQGPYSFLDLQGFYTTGNINHETMVWTEGMAEWVPAGQVPGLLPQVPQAVALPTAAPVAQAQPVQAGGINLSPQVGGVTTPSLTDTATESIPGWISWSTILIGIISLVLFLMPFTSMSMDASVFGKKEQMEIFSQTGFQAVARKYTPNVEFLIQPYLMMGFSEKDATKLVEEGLAAEEAEGPTFERSNLALTTAILAGVGLLLAFAGYAAQNKYLFLSAQVLFVAGAGLLYVQTARQFPIVKSMKEELAKGAREAIAEAEEEPAPVEPKVEEAVEGENGEEDGDPEVAGNEDGDDPTEDAGEPGEGTEEGAEDAVAEADENTDADEAANKEEPAKKSEAGKKEAEAAAINLLDKHFQSKIEPACHLTMVFLGLSFIMAIVMMTRSGTPKSTLKQPLVTSQPQPQPGGFRLQ